MRAGRPCVKSSTEVKSEKSSLFSYWKCQNYQSRFILQELKICPFISLKKTLLQMLSQLCINMSRRCRLVSRQQTLRHLFPHLSQLYWSAASYSSQEKLWTNLLCFQVTLDIFWAFFLLSLMANSVSGRRNFDGSAFL